ncbi:hypothetical protein EDB81DRAFT_815661 [Dactylonectria macrodidyma]|uniref:Uncharacterized protein n=1 Tax=Dactylonectria macrodidyma TaxID=307937 RepID=A0A9P9IFY9_9HYPO|nr:hypothetical protein EDB81DRAFT_815661 [Dactylonectria macrodidyma]
MCWLILDKDYTMTEDVPVYAAALLLDPAKRKSYIEECWPEEWHVCRRPKSLEGRVQSRCRDIALRAILGYACFINAKEGYGALKDALRAAK